MCDPCGGQAVYVCSSVTQGQHTCRAAADAATPPDCSTTARPSADEAAMAARLSRASARTEASLAVLDVSAALLVGAGMSVLMPPLRTTCRQKGCS